MTVMAIAWEVCKPQPREPALSAPHAPTPSPAAPTSYKAITRSRRPAWAAARQTMDRSHPGQPHWEAGGVKVDPLIGATRQNNYGRPALKNGKSKVNY